MSFYNIKTMVGLIVFWCSVIVVQADNDFPFVIPRYDATPGTVTDVSFLNVKPAGKNGRIVVKDGHFAESNTGQKVRFLGVNIGAPMCFPEKEDAPALASHLAKAGYNVVRLHHIHTAWAKTLMNKSYKDTQHIDAKMLDNMEYLIYQLKQNGIYVTIGGLRTVRELTPEDGMPVSICDGVKNDFTKRVDRFNNRWIELQKDFAKQLLTHVNPYTKLPLTDDPAVLAVEISNENSILDFPRRGSLTDLPAYFRDDLKARWNAWLKTKYKTDDHLNKAWSPPAVIGLKKSIISSANQWTFENHNGTRAALQNLPASNSEVATPIAVVIRESSAIDWHIQAHLAGLDLSEGTPYTLTFKIRSDKPRQGRITVNTDRAPWHFCGLDIPCDMSMEWQSQKVSFIATNIDDPRHVRVAFLLGGSGPGKIEITDVTLMPSDNESAALKPGESLSSGTVGLVPTTGLFARRADWLQFLTELDCEFSETMRDYLINKLHLKANLVDTQIEYGGLSALPREAESDFIDAHAYWNHPSFSGKAWDKNSWSILNSAQIDAIVDRKPNPLQQLAERRIADKPYTISEYDHPAPNDYLVEMMPQIATIASLQDWDGFYTFAYGFYPDRIGGFFDCTNNPGIFGFSPAVALIYRKGLLRANPRVYTLHLPNRIWSRNGSSFGSIWDRCMENEDDATILNSRLQVDSNFLASRAAPNIKKTMDSRCFSDVSARKNGKHGVLLASGDAFSLVSGSIGSLPLDAGALTVCSNKEIFASILLVAYDLKPIKQSSRMLLTVGSHFENQGMEWNKTRTSVGNNWGHGPIMASFVPLNVKISCSRALRVFVLDNVGGRSREVEASFANGTLCFSTTPEDRTIWYELVQKQ